MKDFKNSTRMVSGHHFSPKHGFTGSTGNVQNISYTRKTPRRGPAAASEGGPVSPRRPVVRGSSVAGKGAIQALRDSLIPSKGGSLQRVSGPVSQMDHKKGGRIRKAEGGPVDSSLHSFKEDSQLNVEHGPSGGLRPGFTRGGKARMCKAEGGGVMRKVAKDVIKEHIATPAPKGHKGLKSC